MAQPRDRRKGWRPAASYGARLTSQELGLPIPDKAIEQMKANLELDDEQFKIAAEEEKKAMKHYINMMHSRVKGGEGKTAYYAKDPHAQLWVAATIYATILAGCGTA